MNSIKHAGQYFSSKAQQGSAAASKEANKSVAKDRHVSIGTRLRAAKNVFGNKVDEKRHATNADVHRNAAKHNY